MTHAEPFTPDADYCVYCHAPAAGQCAVCAALCCPDCVELVPGLVTPRATCHACLARGARLPGWGVLVRGLLPWAAGLLALVVLLAWLGRG